MGSLEHQHLSRVLGLGGPSLLLIANLDNLNSVSIADATGPGAALGFPGLGELLHQVKAR